jgi:replicative DNA helicase
MTEPMPSNPDAERSVLTSMILYPDDLDEFAGRLQPDDFYDSRNRLIFQVAADLHNLNVAVNAQSVAAQLHNQGKLQQAGGGAYIAGLLGEPAVIDVDFYVDLIRDKTIKRRLIEAGNAAQKAGFKDQAPAAELLDRYQQMFIDIDARRGKDDGIHIQSLLVDVAGHLETVHNHPGTITGVPSGFCVLDNLLSGFQKGDLYVIAGRPGMGKTAMALSIAVNAAKSSRSCGIFSLEMSKEQLGQRLLSIEAQVNLLKFRTGKFTPGDWERTIAAAERLSQTKIYFNDSAGLHYLELRRRARRYQKKWGIEMIIIDYLQLVKGDGKNGRVEEIASVSRNLKTMAKELNIPVIALSQLNRAVESREEKRPKLSDLRDSGAIEQDADAVLFIYRDEVYHKDTTDKGLAEIMIAKQRNGPTGAIRLAFNSRCTRFDNLAQEQNG